MKFFQWRDQIVRDLSVAVLNALVVLVITSFYLLSMSTKVVLETTEMNFAAALAYTVGATLNHTKTIIYTQNKR